MKKTEKEKELELLQAEVRQNEESILRTIAKLEVVRRWLYCPEPEDRYWKTSIGREALEACERSYVEHVGSLTIENVAKRQKIEELGR